MLTQKQIDIIRSRDCTFSGELDELLDMAETLLAVQWAKQWNVQNSEPDTCHNCPLRKRCFTQETGWMYLCLHAVKFSNEWRAAYREAQKIEGVE